MIEVAPAFFCNINVNTSMKISGILILKISYSYPRGVLTHSDWFWSLNLFDPFCWQTPCLEYLDIRNTLWTEQSLPLLGRSLRLDCCLTVLHMENANLSGRSLFLLGMWMFVPHVFSACILQYHSYKIEENITCELEKHCILDNTY